MIGVALHALSHRTFPRLFRLAIRDVIRLATLMKMQNVRLIVFGTSATLN